MEITDYIDISTLRSIRDDIEVISSTKIYILDCGKKDVISGAFSSEIPETSARNIEVMAGDKNIGTICIYIDGNDMSESRLSHTENLIRREINDKIKEVMATRAGEQSYIEYVRSTIEALEQLKNQSRLFSKIESKQKILALNASIEAARAGEQGKSFSVIAGEVGDLAKKSGEANKTVKEINEKITKSLEELRKNIDIY